MQDNLVAIYLFGFDSKSMESCEDDNFAFTSDVLADYQEDMDYLNVVLALRRGRPRQPRRGGVVLW